MAQITKTDLIQNYLDKIRELINAPQIACDQINIYLDLIKEQMRKKPK